MVFKVLMVLRGLRWCCEVKCMVNQTWSIKNPPKSRQGVPSLAVLLAPVYIITCQNENFHKSMNFQLRRILGILWENAFIHLKGGQQQGNSASFTSFTRILLGKKEDLFNGNNARLIYQTEWVWKFSNEYVIISASLLIENSWNWES